MKFLTTKQAAELWGNLPVPGGAPLCLRPYSWGSQSGKDMAAAAGCVLQGNIDASEYKSVVLGLVFLK